MKGVLKRSLWLCYSIWLIFQTAAHWTQKPSQVTDTLVQPLFALSTASPLGGNQAQEAMTSRNRSLNSLCWRKSIRLYLLSWWRLYTRLEMCKRNSFSALFNFLHCENGALSCHVAFVAKNNIHPDGIWHSKTKPWFDEHMQQRWIQGILIHKCLLAIVKYRADFTFWPMLYYQQVGLLALLPRTVSTVHSDNKKKRNQLLTSFCWINHCQVICLFQIWTCCFLYSTLIIPHFHLSH